MTKLSDTKLRALKPREKPYKVHDSEGLFVIVKPNSTVHWRCRYHWTKKRKYLALGLYPRVSLADARKARDDAHALVVKGIDPAEEKKNRKDAALTVDQRSYKVISRDWLSMTAKARGWTDDHRERVERRFEVHFDPWLGKRDIGVITDDEFLACINRMLGDQLVDTVRRAMTDNESVWRYAKARKLAKVNVVSEVRDPGLIPKTKRKHHATLKDPKLIGPLLKAIDGYFGGFIVRCALRLQPLLLARPSELRLATWSEFDLDHAEWRIPAERMKMREQHIVPLSKQAVAILRELHAVTGPEGLVIQGARNASRPISDNTLNAALRTLGYRKDQQTGHGFRSMASTLLNELGWPPDAIERQLAHAERDESRESYNSAEYLPVRRVMMQKYADYLDALKTNKPPRDAIRIGAPPHRANL